MILQLNHDIKKDVFNGKLKAVKLITYLIKKGFNTDQEPQKTSLLDLTFEGKKVKQAYFKNFELIIKF